MRLTKDRALLLVLTAELGYVAFWGIVHALTILLTRGFEPMTTFQYGVYYGADGGALLFAFLLAPLGAYLVPWVYLRLPWGTRVGAYDQVLPSLFTIASLVGAPISPTTLYLVFGCSLIVWPAQVLWFVSRRA